MVTCLRLFARVSFVVAVLGGQWCGSASARPTQDDVTVATDANSSPPAPPPFEIAPDFTGCNCSHQRLAWENPDARNYRSADNSGPQGPDKATELTQYRPAILAPNADPEIREIPVSNNTNFETVVNVGGVSASSIGVVNAPGACAISIVKGFSDATWVQLEACLPPSAEFSNDTNAAHSTTLRYCYESRKTIHKSNSSVLFLGPELQTSSKTYSSGTENGRTLNVGIVELSTLIESARQRHPIAAYYISADVRHSMTQNIFYPSMSIRVTGDNGLKFNSKVLVAPPNDRNVSANGGKIAHRVHIAVDAAGGQVSFNLRALSAEEETQSFDNVAGTAGSDFYALSRRVELCKLTKSRSTLNASVETDWQIISPSTLGLKVSEFNISIGMFVKDTAETNSSAHRLAEYLEQPNSSNITAKDNIWACEIANFEISGVL